MSGPLEACFGNGIGVQPGDDDLVKSLAGLLVCGNAKAVNLADHGIGLACLADQFGSLFVHVLNIRSLNQSVNTFIGQFRASL